MSDVVAPGTQGSPHVHPLDGSSPNVTITGFNPNTPNTMPLSLAVQGTTSPDLPLRGTLTDADTGVPLPAPNGGVCTGNSTTGTFSLSFVIVNITPPRRYLVKVESTDPSNAASDTTSNPITVTGP
jgi:hypothetical protein